MVQGQLNTQMFMVGCSTPCWAALNSCYKIQSVILIEEISSLKVDSCPVQVQ